jgi:hypothetical protein
MRKLPKPSDENGVAFVPKEVFELCISKVRNPNLKARLKVETTSVVQSSLDYDAAANGEQLHKVKRQSKIGKVTKREMIGIYTNSMVPETQPGRPVYDRILNAPMHNRCPLCDVGWVDTLDHHLPKKKYPILSVTPNNLIPSCMRCQKAKGTAYPTSAGAQTIHPYFDDFESETWLQAEVVQTSPATFRFFVQAPTTWNKTTVQRLNSHLATFKLPVLYAANAGSALTDIRYRLNGLFALGAAAAVQKHLQDEATSLEQVSKNLWRAAMFRAAAACNWFCGGGFK